MVFSVKPSLITISPLRYVFNWIFLNKEMALAIFILHDIGF